MLNVQLVPGIAVMQQMCSTNYFWNCQLPLFAECLFGGVSTVVFDGGSPGSRRSTLPAENSGPHNIVTAAIFFGAKCGILMSQNSIFLALTERVIVGEESERHCWKGM